MLPDVLLLVNPTSGGGRGRAVADTGLAELERLGTRVELVQTRDSSDLADRARAGVARGIAIIAVAGGDGSVQVVAEVVANSNSALGLLPCGRGNDLARALGVPFAPPQAARLLHEAHTRTVDVGRAGSRLFMTVATFGFDAAVAGIVHRREVPGRGPLAYGLAVLKGLARHRAVEATLEGDFGRIEGRFFLVASANTRSYGAGVRIAPAAEPDDGLLDVCVVADLPRWRVLPILPSVLSGGHIDHPAVTMLRTRRLRIDCADQLPVFADGEPVGSAPTSIEAVPSALRVVAPRRSSPRVAADRPESAS